MELEESYLAPKFAGQGPKTAFFHWPPIFSGNSSSDGAETTGNGSAAFDLPRELPFVPYFSLRGHFVGFLT
ncbi:MAG: hypothetical protein GY820_24130 [Gammaproteobacteria bacterium]|nr:hypothetical protein [Gammaproteobacteria bacterium]